MVKAALAAICTFTLLATAYLTASLLILHPARANYQQWAFTASVIAAQGVLTLTALWSGTSIRQAISGRGGRYLVAVGGAIIAALGSSAVYSTLASSHFEGYKLVLGSMLVIQGLLTLIAFAGSPAGTVAQLRH